MISAKVVRCSHHLIPQSYSLVQNWLSHCNVLDQSENFVVIFLQIFQSTSQGFQSFWTKKNNQICRDIFRSPHSQYKWVCSRKQLCCKPWGLIVEIKCSFQKEDIFSWERKLGNDLGAASCCFSTFLPRWLSRDIFSYLVFVMWLSKIKKFFPFLVLVTW